jgi:hypothetical protein
MIIDGHAHAAGVFFSAETLVSVLDELGVDKAVLCQNVRFDPGGAGVLRVSRFPKKRWLLSSRKISSIP